MGLPFHFEAGEGPRIEKPIREVGDVSALRTDRAAELGYVAESVGKVASTLPETSGNRILWRSVHARQLHD